MVSRNYFAFLRKKDYFVFFPNYVFALAIFAGSFRAGSSLSLSPSIVQNTTLSDKNNTLGFNI